MSYVNYNPIKLGRNQLKEETHRAESGKFPIKLPLFSPMELESVSLWPQRVAVCMRYCQQGKLTWALVQNFYLGTIMYIDN